MRLLSRRLPPKRLAVPRPLPPLQPPPLHQPSVRETNQGYRSGPPGSRDVGEADRKAITAVIRLRPSCAAPAAENRADAPPHTPSTSLTEIQNLPGTASRPGPAQQSAQRPAGATDEADSHRVSWQSPRQTVSGLRQPRHRSGDRLQNQSSLKQLHRHRRLRRRHACRRRLRDHPACGICCQHTAD